jgi:hypothetical protein
MRKALGLLGLTVVLALSAPVAAREKTVPAEKLFMYLDKFLKVPAPERTRMRLRYVLRSDGQPMGNVKVALVEANGARTTLPVGEDGEFDHLPTLSQLAGKSKIVVDVPAEKKFGISMNPAPALKLAQEYDAREVALAVSESNTVMRKAAGPALALMVPKFAGIGFIGSQNGQVIFGDGRIEALPIVGGVPVFLPDTQKGAVRIKLARVPTRLGYDDGKK